MTRCTIAVSINSSPNTRPKRLARRRVTYTPGTYFCVGTHGFVPTVIKMATHSLVDHAGVITDTAGSIVEAMPGGVRISNINEYKGSYLLISPAEESTPEQRGIIVD